MKEIIKLQDILGKDLRVVGAIFTFSLVIAVSLFFLQKFNLMFLMVLLVLIGIFWLLFILVSTMQYALNFFEYRRKK